MNTQPGEAIPHRPEADTFDLLKSWEYMRQAAVGHRALIVLSALFTVGLMLLYIMIWPSVYQAEVTLIADAEDDKQRVEFYRQWNVFRSNNLRDEVHLINSRTILEQTVDELDLTYDDVYHPFLSYAAHLWGDSLVGKSYRKLKYLVFGRPCEPNCPSEEEQLRAKMVRDFSTAVALIPEPESYVGTVAVKASSARVSEIANTLVDKFLEARKMRYLTEAQKSYDSLLAETDKARAALIEAEAEKERYSEENGILLELEKDKVEVTKWLELRFGIVEAESIKASLEESIINLDRQLETERRHVISGRVYMQNSRRSILEDQLVQLKMALNRAEIHYMPESPEVTDLKKQIAAVSELIGGEQEMEESQFNQTLSDTYEAMRQNRAELLSSLAGVKAGLEVKYAAEEELRAKVDQLPSKIRATRAMGREQSMLENKFIALQDKLTVAAVSLATVASAPPSIKIVDPAVPVDKPSWPMKKLLLVLALFLGAFGGFMLGLFFDLIRRRVNRFSLGPDHIGDALFAAVRKDSDRLYEVFSLPPPPEPSLLTKLVR